MLKSKLYERTLYLNKEIDYLFNCEIREYDLKSAGLNLIKYFKLYYILVAFQMIL